MPHIEWDESLLIGVEEIDDQHKRMFTLINELQDELSAGHGAVVIYRILNLMIQYVQYHFSTEELYMKQIGYPSYDEHKREHVVFIEHIRLFKHKHKQSSPLLAREIITYLEIWYIEHIVHVDRLIGVYLLNRNNRIQA